MADVSAWWLPLAAAAGPAFDRGLSAILQLRRDRRDAGADTSAQMAKLVDMMRAELERTRTMSDRVRDDLDRLRAARFTLEDQVAELRDQALAARTMVHELQRRVGLPETVFQPLPIPALAPARDPPP